MTHEWKLDLSVYYEATCWSDMEYWDEEENTSGDLKFYICLNCNTHGTQSLTDGEIYSYDNITCEEVIIKNIIE